MRIFFRGANLLPPSARRRDLLLRAAKAALGRKSKSRGELNILFVGDREIRRLNKRHLGHDYATDVIAFPYDAEPGGRGEPDPPFGDVVVSADAARRQAAELGHSVLREALTLVAHGTLHLMGYDDHRPKDRARMFARQDRISSRLLRP